MKLVESILTQNPCYRDGRKITVTGLMLHSVGCPQPSAEVFIRAWNKPDYRDSCVHAIIDGGDATIYQTLPWNHRGWHCGGSANNTHIGVEMCEPSAIKYNASGTAFTAQNVEAARAVATRTYNAAVELFAHLCSLHGLNPLADGVIISHSEGYKRGIASGHADPEHLWRGLGLPYTMDAFRADVYARMHPVEKPTPAQTAAQTQGVLLPPDVGDDFWAEDAIRWAVTNGLMQGYPDGTFRPDNPVTRAELATILWRMVVKSK